MPHPPKTYDPIRVGEAVPSAQVETPGGVNRQARANDAVHLFRGVDARPDGDPATTTPTPAAVTNQTRSDNENRFDNENRLNKRLGGLGPPYAL